MITFDQERPQDSAEIDALLDAAFGPERLKKSSNILRKNSPELKALSRVMRAEGHVVATVRFTPVHVRDALLAQHADALLLGPLAVDPMMQGAGLGAELMKHSLAAVDAAGYERIILVGDQAYYGGFGFEQVLPRLITMPGGKDASRLLVRQQKGVEPLPLLGTVQPGWCSAGRLLPKYLPAA